MQTEFISRDRLRLFSSEFDARALALLPHQQRDLLKLWLKSNGGRTRSSTWGKLLNLATKAGGQHYVEVAESLALSLAGCGAAILEQVQKPGGVRVNNTLIWNHYERICAEVGMKTAAARQTAFEHAWNNACETRWERTVLAAAYASLPDATANVRERRLSLLLALNAWLTEGRCGTKRNFSLSAFDGTKEVTDSEWKWLDETFKLEDCGIANHAPAFWLAGDMQLQIEDRWLDIGACGDFIALTPETISKAVRITAKAEAYWLIENRTSFENAVRKRHTFEDIIIWLPGYAPSWWKDCVNRLLGHLPLPAKISCDTDPDGVQIALQAGELWYAHGLSWGATSMGIEQIAAAQHKKHFSAHDTQLASSLLEQENLPQNLRALLAWCMEHRVKAEQENWL